MYLLSMICLAIGIFSCLGSANNANAQCLSIFVLVLGALFARIAGQRHKEYANELR